MYKVEFGYPIGVHTRDSVGCGHWWTFEEAVEDFERSIKKETMDSKKVVRVVMSKMGGIYIGKSRYQAEEALRYLMRNYPNFNDHHISGTGDWDNPYYVFMSKDIRTYDLRTKQEFISKTDYN